MQAKSILKIPVPKVFAWSSAADNPVESEYILMEEAPGTCLAESWEGMRLDSKAKIIEDLVAIEKKLLSMSFTQ